MQYKYLIDWDAKSLENDRFWQGNSIFRVTKRFLIEQTYYLLFIWFFCLMNFFLFLFLTGAHHSVDSSDWSFEQAGYYATEECK